MKPLNGAWNQLQALKSMKFRCGHCGSKISSDRGYYAAQNSVQTGRAYWCHECNRLSVFDNDIRQVPAPTMGRAIKKLPEDVNTLYEELRKASSEGAYSLVVLGGRKLLMHIAVSLGADENLKFVEYVKYLEKQHYTPPKSKSWVKEIKDMGNESNHELILSTEDAAAKIIMFLDLLMTFNYEYADEDTSESEAESE